MSESHSNDSNQYLAETYEIRVKGHLHQKRVALFEGLSITCKEDGTTILYGTLPDQTALHGVLLRIRNMNLKLISVRQISGNADNPKTRMIGMENNSNRTSVSDASGMIVNTELNELGSAPSSNEAAESK